MRLYKLGLLTAFALSISCDNEDFTGESRLKPTSPVISVTLPTISIEQEGNENEFLIGVTMSVAQIVDVAVHAKQIAGTAVLDEDFEIESRIIIPAGETQGSFTLKVLSDCSKEEPKTVTLQIGDQRTANADIDPVEMSFTINNFVDEGIDVHTEWTGSFNGNSPTALVDIDLYLVNESITTVYAKSETLGFESFNSGSLSDGTYLVYAALYEFRVPAIADPDFIDDFGTIDFPISLEINRCGSFDPITIAQTDNIISTDGNFADAVLATIVVQDGQYQILDQSDNIVIEGRAKDSLSKIRDLVKSYSLKR
jgi:hypothetical protein